MNTNNTQIDGDMSVGRNVAVGGAMNVQGDATVNHDLTVKGWLNAPNIKGPNKGVFTSLDDLSAVYPTPQDGWYAGVGTSAPFALYVGKNGVWTATGGTMSNPGGSHFMGYAPATNPTPVPTEERVYITARADTNQGPKTYTGYGNSSWIASQGTQYIIWWDGESWKRSLIDRDNATISNDPRRGGAIIRIPSVEGETGTTRTVDVLTSAEDVAHVVRMQVDGVDVAPTNELVFDLDASGDDTAHTVNIVLDNEWGDETPECFEGIEAESITLPYGMRTYNAPVGAPDTEVILPETVEYIDSTAIEESESDGGSSQYLRLTGAPPTLDNDIAWDWIDTLTLPKRYSLLYSADTAWQAAVADVSTANCDDGTSYVAKTVGMVHVAEEAGEHVFSFGSLPEYHVVQWSGDNSITINAIGNSEKNYILIKGTGTITGVTLPNGLTAIGEYKGMPIRGSLNNLNYDALEVGFVKSKSNVIISFAHVGAH